MLLAEHRDYLLSRSYSSAMIAKEEIQSLKPGKNIIEGTEFEASGPVIAWICRSPGGQLIGIQTRRIDEHEYRWAQGPKAQHLPILYGTEEDHDILYGTGRVILAEGLFDRAAIKRCIPDYAVYARLSKGVAKSLVYLLLRYGKQVWTAFDQDLPGEKATTDAEMKLSEKVDFNRLLIPAKDPSALIESRGERRAKEIIERQIRALELR